MPEKKVGGPLFGLLVLLGLVLAVRAGSDGGGDPHGDRGFPAQFFDYYRLATHNAADVTRAIVTELGRLARDPSARRTCRLLSRHRWRRAAKRIDGSSIATAPFVR